MEQAGVNWTGQNSAFCTMSMDMRCSQSAIMQQGARGHDVISCGFDARHQVPRGIWILQLLT